MAKSTRYILAGTQDAPALTGLSAEQCAELFMLPDSEDNTFDGLRQNARGIIFATRASMERFGLPRTKQGGKPVGPPAEITPGQWQIVGRDEIGYFRGVLATKEWLADLAKVVRADPRIAALDPRTAVAREATPAPKSEGEA